MFSKERLLEHTLGESVLVISPSNTYYISGFESSYCYVLFTHGEGYYLTDSRYVNEAVLKIDNLKVMEVNPSNIYATIRELMQGDTTLYYDTDISYKEHEALVQAFADKKLVELGDIILDMRAVKDESEIAYITKAQNIAENAFTKLLDDVHEGVEELELVANLEYYMKKMGGETLSFETIVAFGDNGASPHAHPTHRKLKNGEFITIDFGTTQHGYHGDMTRTFALGEPTAEMKKVYNVVRDAQRYAIDAVEAGKRCSDIDAVARDYIKSQGYGEYFGHGLGHSVGIDIHEEPRFSPSCDYITRENNVITVEPGIYLPKKFGIRIEDIIIVKDNSQIDINNLTSELIIL